MIDLDKLVAAVREVAAEQPDKAFKDRAKASTDFGNVNDDPDIGCKYFYVLNKDEYDADSRVLNYEAPCCIVGHAFVKTGDQQVVKPGTNTSSINNVVIDVNLVREAEDAYALRNEARIKWLTKVQDQQDRGYTWSESVRTADTIKPSHDH